MKIFKFVFTYFFLCYLPLAIADQSSPLFVSLGCNCELAHQLRWNKKRERAFPFDWLITTDCEKFASLLENDFAHFMEIPNFSHSYKGGQSVSLFNLYYNIEFRHDLYGIETNFEDHFPQFKAKYEKRIKRFRALDTFPGKVYFLRTAYPPYYDQSQSIVTKESLALTADHAEALKNALTKLFPHLDFELVILNFAEVPSPEIKDLERVIEFKLQEKLNFADVFEILRLKSQESDSFP